MRVLAAFAFAGCTVAAPLDASLPAEEKPPARDLAMPDMTPVADLAPTADLTPGPDLQPVRDLLGLCTANDDCNNDAGAWSCCVGGRCVDSRNSVESCGACGVSCRGGQPGCCNGQCVDLAADLNNCGRCLNSCAVSVLHAIGLSCSGGRCAYAACQPTEYKDCNGDPSDGCEVDAVTNDNCGDCGIKCIAPRTCHAMGGNLFCAF